MTTVFKEQSCNTLLATMQKKQGHKQAIYTQYGQKLLQMTHDKQWTTYYCVELWSIIMVLNTIPIIVKNCQYKMVNLNGGTTIQEHGIQYNFDPNSHWYKRQRLTYVSHNDHDQTPFCSNIVQLPVVDPSRQLFPWIHRGRGQECRNMQERFSV